MLNICQYSKHNKNYFHPVKLFSWKYLAVGTFIFTKQDYIKILQKPVPSCGLCWKLQSNIFYVQIYSSLRFFNMQTSRRMVINTNIKNYSLKICETCLHYCAYISAVALWMFISRPLRLEIYIRLSLKVLRNHTLSSFGFHIQTVWLSVLTSSSWYSIPSNTAYQ